jgi:hypothetical protein
MKKEIEVKKYIYDNELLIKEIEIFPHSYKTLLGESVKNSTFNFILRRKLNILHKDGLIQKSIIPGTRFGEVLFYSLNKKYHIVIENDRIKNKIYCFFDYVNQSKFYIILEKFYILDYNQWIEKNEKKVLFDGDILKWI